VETSKALSQVIEASRACFILRNEAEELRSLATALERRANSLETAAKAEGASALPALPEARPQPAEPIEPLGLRPKQAAKAENCSLTTLYQRIKKGEYVAVRDGSSTLVTTESIRRRRATLPPAKMGRPVAPRKQGNTA
jgi:hypothetical protein